MLASSVEDIAPFSLTSEPDLEVEYWKRKVAVLSRPVDENYAVSFSELQPGEFSPYREKIQAVAEQLSCEGTASFAEQNEFLMGQGRRLFEGEGP